MVVSAYGIDQVLELEPIDPDAPIQALQSPDYAFQIKVSKLWR